jgi:hypothetical protein
VRCGLTVGDLNTTALTTDFVDGYVLAQQTTGRGTLGHLQAAFYFDVVESDFLVKFPKRGGASLATIPSTEVSAHEPNSTVPAPVSRTRNQDTELPWHIDVRYLDKDRSYKVTMQYARRLSGHSNRRSDIRLPIVVNAAKAKQIAEVNLYAPWMARDRGVMKVSRKYLYLDPADIITYQAADGNAETLLITKTDYSSPNLIELSVQRDDPSIYTSLMPEVPGAGHVEIQKIPITTRMFLMDIPVLLDAVNDAGLYYVLVGIKTGWTAASIYKSTDQGVTWDHVTTVDVEGIAGYADSLLLWEGAIT